MTSLELNTKLIEAFGELEQLCNQIYGSSHGVTEYIEEMRAYNSNIIRKRIPNWNYCLSNLFEIRKKRNKLSHGEVPFSTPYATQDNIDFAIQFKNDIMRQTDPLYEYRKILTSSRPKSVNQTYSSSPQQNYSSSSNNRPSYNQPSECFVALIVGLLILIALMYFVYIS